MDVKDFLTRNSSCEIRLVAVPVRFSCRRDFRLPSQTFSASDSGMSAALLLSFDQLFALRPRADQIAQFLRAKLVEHLETLRPLLDPACVLGTGATPGRIAWMEKCLAEFRALYNQFGRQFRLPTELDVDLLNDAGPKFDVHPWEYSHEARNDRETKPITITTPTRWAIGYSSELTLARMKAITLGREQGKPPAQHRFVLHSLLLKLVVEKSPRVASLLKALRFEFETLPSPELHGLPIVTIRYCLPSFRPDDSLILQATGLSGVPAFIELVDVQSVRSMTDPIKEQLEQIVT